MLRCIHYSFYNSETIHGSHNLFEILTRVTLFS